MISVSSHTFLAHLYKSMLVFMILLFDDKLFMASTNYYVLFFLDRYIYNKIMYGPCTLLTDAHRRYHNGL